MKILNSEEEDYHLHSSNYSDGKNSVDEMAKKASEIGMKKIMFTDHADATAKKYNFKRKEEWSSKKKKLYGVEVLFGVEADIKNKKGEVSKTINNKKSREKNILSLHSIYQNSKKTYTEGIIKSIEKNKEDILCLGHLGSKQKWKNIDLLKVILFANKHGIPIEINLSHFMKKFIPLQIFKKIILEADSVYVNSDAHSTKDLELIHRRGWSEMKKLRKKIEKT